MRRSLLPLLHAFRISLLALLFAPAMGQARNFVANGGFESGLDHWTWEAKGPADGIASGDPEVKHWEGQSLRITGSNARLSQTIEGLTPGTTYYVQAWCRGAHAGSKNVLALGSKGETQVALPSGEFDWTRVSVPFVAEAASEPLAILIQEKTDSLWLDDIYVTAEPCEDAHDLGLAGDGTTDVTAALTELLKAHRFVFLPAGTYLLSAPVTVPSDTTIWGAGAKTLLKQQSPDAESMLTGKTTDTYRVRNIEVSGVSFEGLPRRQMKVEQHGLLFASIEGLLARNCVTRYCGLLVTSLYKGDYRDVQSEENLSKRIRAVYNDIQATAADVGVTGVNLMYTVDADISDNLILHYVHGIMWIGGDANLGRDGQPQNPRWARRIKIDHNVVAHIDMGGIWGGMGANISVTRNDIDTCGDVGIDFEGCIDSIADSNRVADGFNGGLTSFFAARNLLFTNNEVITTNPKWPVFCLFNSSVDPSYVHNILLKNNRFTATNGIGALTDGMGPGELKVIGNTFHNVVLAISRGGDGFNEVGPLVDRNFFLFDRDEPTPFIGLTAKFSFGSTTVTNNTVRFTGAAKENKTGILVQKITAQGEHLTVTGNTVEGFGEAAIRVVGTRGNTATITNNEAAGGPIQVDRSTGLKAEGSDNQDATGAPVELTEMAK